MSKISKIATAVAIVTGGLTATATVCASIDIIGKAETIPQTVAAVATCILLVIVTTGAFAATGFLATIVTTGMIADLKKY